MNVPPSTDEVSELSPASDDAHSVLQQARLLRHRGAMDEARVLLDKALLQWPQNDQVKELLLQTEKDQLALRRQKTGGSDETGLAFEPRELLGMGLLGALGASGMLFLIAHTVAFMVRFGFDAPMAQFTRGTRSVYYVPAHSTLAFPLLGLCLFGWMIHQAIKSYSS